MNWYEAEDVKCWGISHNKEVRDETRATVTELDGYNYCDAQTFIDNL